MRNGRIYIIKNKCNNKVYVGQTTLSIEDRFKQHKKPTYRKRCTYKLYKAMNKYGVENFYVELLEDDIPYDLLDKREIYWIEQYDSFKNGYNSTPGGDGKTIYKLDDVNNILDRLRQGDMIKDIAKDYNVSTYTITRTLHAFGYKAKDFRKKGNKKEYLRTLPREKIKELYLQGKTYIEISEALKIHPKSISRVMKEYGIERKPRMDYSELDCDKIIEDIIKWRKGEIQKKDILEKYHITHRNVDTIIKKYFNESSVVTCDFLGNKIHIGDVVVCNQYKGSYKAHLYQDKVIGFEGCCKVILSNESNKSEQPIRYAKNVIDITAMNRLYSKEI